MDARHALPLVLSAVATVSAAQVQVHVVDAAGGLGADFATLAQATAAASDGDIVLVRAGDYYLRDGGEYDGLGFREKGLTVVAEAGALVRTTELWLQAIPARSVVLVHGLELRLLPGAMLEDSPGAVWLSHVDSVGLGNPFSPVLRVRDVGTLVVTHSRLLGEPNFGTPTLQVSGSRLQLFDAEVEGSPNGGRALDLSGGTLWLAGSSLRGGDGRDGHNAFNGCAGQAGGVGLLLMNQGRAKLLDSTLVGGAGGAPFLPSCSHGADAQGLSQSGGSQVAYLAGPRRGLEASSPVREDENVTITLTGRGGDAFALAFSWGLAQGLGPAFDAPTVGSPGQVLSTGTLPPSGVLVLSLPVPDLAPGVEGRVGLVRAVFRDTTTGHRRVSTPEPIVVLDEAL